MFLDASRYTHGTRARYVAGCRCRPCTDANTARYHERRKVAMEAWDAIVPNGPPAIRIEKKLCYGRGKVGKLTEFRMRVCPGTGGVPCAKQRTLKRHPVCESCRDRVTVFDGLVPAAKVKRHLLALRRQGIGYKSVADAASVGHPVLLGVISGKRKHIRAGVERRILAVDEGARADGSLVPSAPTYALVDELRELGFPVRAFSAGLGVSTTHLYAAFRHDQVTAATAHRVAVFHRRALAGEVKPDDFRATVDGAETYRKIRELLKDGGFTRQELQKALGFHFAAVPERGKLKARRVSREHARLVDELHAENVLPEGEDLPRHDEREERLSRLRGLLPCSIDRAQARMATVYAGDAGERLLRRDLDALGAEDDSGTWTTPSHDHRGAA